MVKGYIYIMYGGTLKNKTIKIGKTLDKDGLYDKYKTYYGNDVKGYFCKSDNYDEHEIVVKNNLAEYNRFGELFNCNSTHAKNVIKNATGKTRMHKITKPNMIDRVNYIIAI